MLNIEAVALAAPFLADGCAGEEALANGVEALADGVALEDGAEENWAELVAASIWGR